MEASKVLTRDASLDNFWGYIMVVLTVVLLVEELVGELVPYWVDEKEMNLVERLDSW